MDEEKLVRLVGAYKELYDYGDKNYANQDRKNNCWNEISALMNQPMLDCKERWTRLRDNYRKALKFRRSKSGDATIKLKPCKFEKEMAFLKPFMQDRKNRRQTEEQKPNLVEIASTIVDCVYEDEESNNYIEDNDNVIEAESEEVTPTFSTGATMRQRTPTPTSMSKKRKQSEMLLEPTNSVASVLEKYLQTTAAAAATNSSPGSNSLRQFFIAMAETAQSFPPALQIEVKSKVFNVLHEAELKCLQAKESLQCQKCNAAGLQSNSWT
ncbi:uncharacterized protein LOC114327342 [Diabrotica virgifera virgifera]|uniref:Uncharacterized protein LOC114327342 n=1 Tax=Diabrotica virgifera virgifera TaxID=50390 RepID=A0A6P7F888_DIAVI|nr:uncharacterized protein LOC114327342 [Diabrotica virgifera virgifera]